MSGVSVGHYLAGIAESIARPKHHAAVGHFPFITIARQTGAGGHTLAREIVKQIYATGDLESGGWAIFDEEMCKGILDDPRLTSMLTNLLDERYRTAVQEFVHTLVGGAAQDLAYSKLAQVQRQVAALGKVVFVGSGASCVTKDLPLGVHVRLVASMRERQNRMAELLGVDVSDAVRKIERSDRERERFGERHFATDTTDPENYDVTWCTSRVPYEHVAQSVLALVQARKAAHDQQAT